MHRNYTVKARLQAATSEARQCNRDLSGQAALALFPHRPQAEVFHLLVEAGLFHQRFGFGACLPFPQPLGALGDPEDSNRGLARAAS
jgi:hypothetical protein